MKHIIEKIEGPWAIIEWGKESFKIPKLLLPSNAKVGDKISIEIELHDDSNRLRRPSNFSSLLDDFE